MKVLNSKPKVFYGLHFEDGIAEYKDPPSTIFVSSDTAKKMDASYQGKPVYVLHNSDAKHDDVQSADGIVVRSFYNKSDGNHWAEFIIYTDEAEQAIKKGWTLSNAYSISAKKGSGTWHGAEYDYEVAGGEYDHLAIVPDPRYSDSIILTPEKFKEYNLDKEEELLRLSNSKGESKMKLNFFKREKVTNSKDLDLESLVVVLPKSKKEFTITELASEMDTVMNGKGRANMGDMVKMENDDEVSVKELVNFYKKNNKKNEEDDDKENEDDDDKENMDDDEGSKENMDEDDKENEDDDDKENEDDDDKENEGDEDDKENEDDEDESAEESQNKKSNKKNNSLSEVARLKRQLRAEKRKNIELLENAENRVMNATNSGVVETSDEKIARGVKNYGSKK